MYRIILSAVAITWAGLAWAGDKPEVGAPADWVKPAQLPAIPDSLGDAAISILLQDQQFNFTASGDEGYVENIVRIQTPQGLSGMGTLSIPWQPDTDSLIIHKLHIIRNHETVDVLANQAFTTLRRENNLEYAALDGVLTAVIQPAGLQVGDTLDLAYSIKHYDPVVGPLPQKLAGGWGDFPVQHAQLRARWPSESGIRWKASAQLSNVQETRNGNFTEIAADNEKLEPLVQPVGAPLRFRAERSVEITGFKSWNEVSKKLAPLYSRAAILKTDSPLLAEVSRIRDSTDDPKLRASKALALVQDQVRYVFLGMNDGGLVPADADTTWSRRFGDCKGKTTLLLAILHALNIQAEPIAVNTSGADGLDTRLPMVWWFNHVIVRANIEGKTYWLDGTRNGDRKLDDILVPNLQWGLPLVDKGSTLVRLVPSPLKEPTISTAVRIDASMGISVPVPFHAEATFSGDVATAFKLQLANLTPTNLDAGLRSYWSKQYNWVDVSAVSAKYDQESGQEQLVMDGSAHMEWKDGWYEADGLSVGYKADFTRQPGPNSDAPFAVAFPLYVRSTETIILPNRGEGFTVSGGDIESTIGGVEYRRHATIRNGIFNGEASTRSIASEFPSTEASPNQKALRDMAKSTVYLRSESSYRLTDKDLDVELAKTYDNASAYIRRGDMLSNRRDYDKALADFNKAISLEPNSDLAIADRGIAYYWKGKNSEALTDFQSAIAINSRNAVAYRGLGLLALNAGNYSEAIGDFDRSLDFDPKNTFALQRRATAYSSLGEYQKALADTAEVTRLSPNILETYSLRASIFLRQGDKSAAEKEAEAVMKAGPSDTNAYITAAGIYRSLAEYSKAVNALDRYVEMAHTEASYLTRASYRPKSDLKGRAADVDAALQLNPRSLNALAFRANMQMDAAEYKQAISTLNVALEIDKQNVGLLTLRGIVYAKNMEMDLSNQDLTTARTLATTANSLNNMCWSLATANVAVTLALNECEEAVAKAPKVPAYLDSKGFVMLRLTKYADAIAIYNDALKLAPNITSSLYGRGIAKHRLGDTPGGDADVNSASKLDPDIVERFNGYGITP